MFLVPLWKYTKEEAVQSVGLIKRAQSQALQDIFITVVTRVATNPSGVSPN